MMFGITPSQYHLNATIAERYETVDPEFARKVKEDFYVDDLITGVQSVEKGNGLYKRMKVRIMEAHLNTRRWRTNSKELRSKMTSDGMMKMPRSWE